MCSISQTTITPGETTIVCGVTTASVTTCGTRRRRGSPFIEVEKPEIYRDGRLVEYDEDLIQPSKVSYNNVKLITIFVCI